MHAVLAGYYPKDGPNKSNLEAQIDMIDESLRWAGIDKATEVCPCMHVYGVLTQLPPGTIIANTSFAF